MKKNTLEDYKKAIKVQYELEKYGNYSTFLFNPSRAKLRNLCFELFKDNSKKDDLMSFASFCGFEFSPTSFNKLKDLTDKFRPIETFLKGETDLVDMEAVNITAILVGFEPRPYLKFSKAENHLRSENQIESDGLVNNEIKNQEKNVIEVLKAASSVELNGNRFFYKQISIAVLITFVICGVGFFLLPKEKCMQWQNDHYEMVTCEENKVGVLNLYSKIPLDENMLNFRKIQVCDSTTFFKHNKPIVWYCKKGNELEFYNNPGYHPENDKPLKPITQYMINKYVMGKN
ncbi:hypothetical protein [Flavobacterium ovatum]|uniref:hypothetical protein n=1 Tax=Flavobacterium ovatum TaxID=1928857 RepID=UPI00344C2515